MEKHQRQMNSDTSSCATSKPNGHQDETRTPSIRLFKNVAGTTQYVDEGLTSHTADLMGTTNGLSPIVGGVWYKDNIRNNEDVFAAEWDEVKYILEGCCILEDLATETKLTVEAGDMLWIPKNSRSIIRESTGLKAVYVEQTMRPTVELLAQHTDSDIAIQWTLDKLQQTYITTNPRSAQEHERACKSLPGGNTRSVLYHAPFPLYMASGRDCHVTSLDGHEYLDLVSEYTACLFGHSNLQLQQAALEALNKGFNLGSHNKFELQLAEALIKRFPSIDMIRFCNSGTEANLMAIAVAKAFTQRSHILVFTHGYHGGVLTFEDLENPVNVPHKFLIAEYNSIESVQTILQQAKATNIAAILVEPMQSAGGMIPGDREFLAYLRRAADEIGAILIFDEVVTARLHINGLQGCHQVIPDLTTLGKSIGGGFSIGAFGGSRRIMDRLDPRIEHRRLSHSGTFNNNLFSMIAGVMADKILTQERIGKLNCLGDRLRSGIKAALAMYGITSIHVTGYGSLTGLHFSGPQAKETRAALYFHLLQHRIYIGNRGFMALNFEHKEEHVQRVLCYIQAFAAIISSRNIRTVQVE